MELPVEKTTGEALAYVYVVRRNMMRGTHEFVRMRANANVSVRRCVRRCVHAEGGKVGVIDG